MPLLKENMDILKKKILKIFTLIERFTFLKFWRFLLRLIRFYMLIWDDDLKLFERTWPNIFFKRTIDIHVYHFNRFTKQPEIILEQYEYQTPIIISSYFEKNSQLTILILSRLHHEIDFTPNATGNGKIPWYIYHLMKMLNISNGNCYVFFESIRRIISTVFVTIKEIYEATAVLGLDRLGSHVIENFIGRIHYLCNNNNRFSTVLYNTARYTYVVNLTQTNYIICF